ncbi:inorganic phosphate transporter [Epibacterium sp. SM1969]|uniref:Phosphate transporter n=1 Tax=Tritonibacter aquimaris TaxID=2663379 RepID=A0A844AZC9_9RHOB|nr:inorganic phosphate transporter [Tritonibacter aquimaris]MQY43342.1 inorganic phosphate transporter [Tritonibacter aquimaris]
MSNAPSPKGWRTLDKDLSRISQVELAATYVARGVIGKAAAAGFVVLAVLLAAASMGHLDNMVVVLAATVLGAYMALNIGANDVSNNMGPAVGARALPMGAAILIAAIAESAGALLAGSNVVHTISYDILQIEHITDVDALVWAMLAALMSAALWVNFSTWVGAPVSTTHSVVGGVLGAGLVALGSDAVNWPLVALIAANWVVSPLMGAVIAALFLAFVKTQIAYKEDKIAAAARWVPVLVAIMAGAFTSYLMIKGVDRIFTSAPTSAPLAGLVVGGLTYVITAPIIRHRAKQLENRNRDLKTLFTLPLVISATLLSFAHGANDVANAIGPLAAIVHVTQTGSSVADVEVPRWVMVIGALGISFGLFLFGPKLIRMVGDQITKLNPMRAFCVSLSAAITVIFASSLGLPVSSTHVAVGGVFGVGFFREWHMARQRKKKKKNAPVALAAEEGRRRKLVRRSHFMTIIAAWMFTVPAAAALSAMIFSLIRLGLM